MLCQVHQIDVNDVTIVDRKKNWCERGARKAVLVRTKNPSLNCNGTGIRFSHSWNSSINTMQLFSIDEKLRKYEVNQKTAPAPVITSTTTQKKTNGTSGNVDLPQVFFVLVVKN